MPHDSTFDFADVGMKIVVIEDVNLHNLGSTNQYIPMAILLILM